MEARKIQNRKEIKKEGERIKQLGQDYIYWVSGPFNRSVILEYSLSIHYVTGGWGEERARNKTKDRGGLQHPEQNAGLWTLKALLLPLYSAVLLVVENVFPVYFTWARNKPEAIKTSISSSLNCY